MKPGEDRYRLLPENNMDGFTADRAFGESRKRKEIALRENSQFLHCVFESIKDEISVIDPSLTIRQANSAVRKRYKSQLPLEGKKCFQVYHKRDEPCHPCPSLCCLQSGEMESEEINVSTDLEERWIECISYPIKEQGIKKISGVVEFVRDITTRKIEEALLREREENLRVTLNSIGDAAIATDTRGCITYMNPVAEKFTGWKLNEAQGEPLHDIMNLINSRTREPYANPVGRVLATGKTMALANQTTLLSRDGTEYQIADSAAPILNTEGQTIGVILVFRDVTRECRLQEAIELSEKRFKMIMASMQDVVFTLDKEQRYTGVYGPWVENSGLTPGYFLGKTSLEILGAEDSRVHREANVRALQGEFVIYEWSRSTGGNILHYQTSLSPIRDREGNVQELVGIGRNITDRKKIEDHIRYMSFHDNLTGLYNRAYMEEEMIRLDTKRQTPISIIMADLNGLKLVNDTYGHSKGDEMLKNAAETIKKSCRQEDIVARWGGDEFVILLPQTTPDEVEAVSRRILSSFEESYIRDVPISIAIGAACKQNIKQNILKVLREAENNMYKQKLTESSSTKSALLKTLLKTLEERSFETKAHVQHMQKTARQVCKKLKLPDNELGRLELIINLHDIGKIKISEEILTKKSSLTAREWEIIKKHPETGYRIAQASGDFAHVAEDIFAHHEHWDGSGYPRGLQGKNIPFLARIVAIVDAYDVMSNGRPYQKRMTHREIVAEFKSCAGTQFDPELIEIFLKILDAKRNDNKHRLLPTKQKARSGSYEMSSSSDIFR